jgi:putative methyltransferase (TIGR04325 family)
MPIDMRVLKAITPPFVGGIYRSIRGVGIQFRGRYPNWVSAEQRAEGYEAGQILECVRQATHKVVRGEASCERDSVLFHKTPYPFPVIAVLLRAALENQGRLNVLDFGGALGSSFYQCRDFLREVSPLRWCVVEQPHYVECGRREFESEILSFHESVDACVRVAPPQVILASGVLQYMPDPASVLGLFLQSAADYIVIDRTPVSIRGEQVISVQSVPSSINRSSYPLWLFNEAQLKAPLMKDYVEISRFDAVDGTLGSGRLKAEFKGFMFKKKEAVGTP